jgi:hypothetical protein
MHMYSLFQGNYIDGFYFHKALNFASEYHRRTVLHATLS